MVKNLPVNAGDMGFIPDLGSSHKLQSGSALVPQLLSPGAATAELRAA